MNEKNEQKNETKNKIENETQKKKIQNAPTNQSKFVSFDFLWNSEYVFVWKVSRNCR